MTALSDTPLAAIILAAGNGTRMKSDLHKVLHPIAGQPMLHHILDTLESLAPRRTVLVVGAKREQVEANSRGASIAVQSEQLGTGHAVKVCKDALDGFGGDIVVLYGDVPFVPASTITDMRTLKAEKGHGAVVLGFTPDDAGKYGRLIVSPAGQLERIVEFKDLDASQKHVDFCNSGIMLIDGAHIWQWLDEVDNKNAAGEYYLTDLVEIIRKHGGSVGTVEAAPEHVVGVNSRSELASAEALFQARVRRRMMEDGVTLTAPDTVFFAYDTEVEADVTIEPHVVFGPGVTVKSGASVRAFSHLEGCRVESGAVVGPYARLRPDAHIGKGAKVGNFVEIKKATVSAGAKVNHLSYIGDAFIGADANIGAGTITCNYDGYMKYETNIGAGAFIGSNSALVAPVSIGDGAIVGAGSTITKDVEADALSVTRAEQKTLSGKAARLRAVKERQKAAKIAAKKK